ncbi:MAG: glutamate-cysteine ligase family protein, partial [Planctomycetota bacterium]|nr:glutamate-cysteine ligase family protein [Planctomycetota bacterium]
MPDEPNPDPSGDSRRRAYLKGLLRDLDALERMLEGGVLESGVRRIGAEQEVAIVDRSGGPFPIADELLRSLPPGPFTNELGRFNLEVNFNPIAVGAHALRDLEQQVHAHLGQLRAVARQHDAMILLVGIMPSLSRDDLVIGNLTDKPRYHELNDALSRLRGGPYELNIDGIDELSITHDNIMLEACNTSFQVHFQVDPDSFARWYNIAQLASAPVLAAATNSPVLLNRRLWRETRIALFQQSIDTRTPQSSGRRIPP